MKIDYVAIIKKAFGITWKNKFLWWFGFFILLGGGCRFNYTFQDEGDSEKVMDFFSYLQNERMILLALGISFLILLAFLVFIAIRGRVALIKSIGNILNNKKCNFSIGFKEGKNYFWKIFLARIIIGFIIFGTLVILLIPILFLVSMKAYLMAILAAIFAVSIILVIIVLSAFIQIYSDVYIVLANIQIRDAFENAYLLFRKNMLPSIIMVLFFIPFNLAFFIGAFLAALALFFVFGPFALIGWLIFSKIGAIIVLGAALAVFGFVMIIANSAYNVFTQTVWILFFDEIAKQKKEEAIEVEEEKIIDSKIPNPEEA